MRRPWKEERETDGLRFYLSVQPRHTELGCDRGRVSEKVSKAELCNVGSFLSPSVQKEISDSYVSPCIKESSASPYPSRSSSAVPLPWRAARLSPAPSPLPASSLQPFLPDPLLALWQRLLLQVEMVDEKGAGEQRLPRDKEKKI